MQTAIIDELTITLSEGVNKGNTVRYRCIVYRKKPTRNQMGFNVSSSTKISPTFAFHYFLEQAMEHIKGETSTARFNVYCKCRKFKLTDDDIKHLYYATM